MPLPTLWWRLQEKLKLVFKEDRVWCRGQSSQRGVEGSLLGCPLCSWVPVI